MLGLEKEKLDAIALERNAKQKPNRLSSLRFANVSAIPTDCKSLSHTLVSATTSSTPNGREKGKYGDGLKTYPDKVNNG